MLKRLIDFRHIDTLEDGWDASVKGKPVKGERLVFYDGEKMGPWEHKFRKAHWEITAVLVTDQKVGKPVNVWSGKPDLEDAVMNVVRHVYNLGIAEERTTETVAYMLWYTKKGGSFHRRIDFDVSEEIRMSIYVTDISGIKMNKYRMELAARLPRIWQIRRTSDSPDKVNLPSEKEKWNNFTQRPLVIIDGVCIDDGYRSFHVEDKSELPSASKNMSININAVVEPNAFNIVSLRKYYMDWMRQRQDERVIEHYPDGVKFDENKAVYKVRLTNFEQIKDEESERFSLQFSVTELLDTDYESTKYNETAKMYLELGSDKYREKFQENWWDITSMGPRRRSAPYYKDVKINSK